MIYRFGISTPASTTKQSPQKTLLKLTRGIVYKFDVDFPAGSQGALHVVLKDGNSQVWPTNPEEDFAADDRLITFPEHHELLRGPYRLTAETWNESLNNAHIVIIRIGVLARKFVLRRII